MGRGVHNSETEIVRDSLMVRIRACRVRDRGSIPRRGEFLFLTFFVFFYYGKNFSTLEIKKLISYVCCSAHHSAKDIDVN